MTVIRSVAVLVPLCLFSLTMQAQPVDKEREFFYTGLEAMIPGGTEVLKQMDAALTQKCGRQQSLSSFQKQAGKRVIMPAGIPKGTRRAVYVETAVAQMSCE